MTTNYRGKEITWVRLFRVLNDYLDGRRKYSWDTREELCLYRLNGKPECPTACLIGSFLSDDKYCLELNVLMVSSIADKLTTGSLLTLMDIHDCLAKGEFSLAWSGAKCLIPPQRHIKKKIEIIEKISKLIETTN